MPLVDRDKIVDAIAAAKVGADAKNFAASLVEAWVEEHENTDAHLVVHAVEVPFYILIAKKTYVVGQQDAIFADDHGFLSGEWKTQRAPRIRRDGEPYEGESEADWLEEISSGPQLATYALAAREGRFYITRGGSVSWPALACERPRVMVRCVLKSKPPAFWPTDPANGIFTFSDADLEATRNAYLAKAASIRIMRKLGRAPWQLVGRQCKQFKRVCENYTRCREHRYPPITPNAWAHPDDAAPDPGYIVCKLLELDPKDPELVVLSQSAYQAYTRCAELGRTAYGGYFTRDVSYELEVGTATHAGLAELYAQRGVQRIDQHELQLST